MSRPDKLFSLINVLTKSEKRYFKLTVSSIHEGEKIHLKLFNAIEKQKNIDDNKLKEQFQGEKFIKRLPYEKFYLYNLILKSLRNFHSGISIDAELYDAIRDVEILLSKMLLAPATQLIEKAYAKAIENERFSQALTLLEYERKIHVTNSHRQEIISEENKKLTRIINNLNEYSQITIEIAKAVLSFGGSLSTKEQEKKLRAYYAKNPLLNNSNAIYSFSAKCKYYMLNSTYFFYLHELEKSYYYIVELHKLFKQQPVKIRALKDLFNSNLINGIQLSFLLRKFDESKELLKEFEAIPPDSQNFLKQKILTLYFGLTIATLSGNSAEGRKLIGKSEEVFRETMDLVQQAVGQYMLAYKIAYFYFSNGNFKVALKWINIILNKKESILDHILCRTHILFLITHYELENYDYLDTVLGSTSTLLRKKNVFSSPEKALFTFLKKAPALASKERMPTLKALKKLFEKSCADPLQRKVINFFDYVAWAEAKIENITMAEVLREKR